MIEYSLAIMQKKSQSGTEVGYSSQIGRHSE